MEKLFGEVDNLNMFVHPKFNEKFKRMQGGDLPSQ